MSYCVNCGVELHPTCSACPLCQTKVYNPNQPTAADIPTPFPTVRGETEPVNRREFTILMTIIFLTTSIVCGVLNFFTFPYGKWSFYVIGVCMMLWVFMLPIFFPSKADFFLCSILDGISIALYLGGISILHPGDNWYFHIALPMIVLTTVLIQIFLVFSVKLKRSMITRAAILLGNIGIFCAALELMIDFHAQKRLALSWSAVVLTCCITIDVILITISLQKGLRSELRRRMHF